MTLKEAIKQAYETKNAERATEIAQNMCFKGCDYDQMMSIVKRAVGSEDARQGWEALLYEGGT